MLTVEVTRPPWITAPAHRLAPVDSPQAGKGRLPTARRVAPWTTPPAHRLRPWTARKRVKGGCPPDNPPAITKAINALHNPPSIRSLERLEGHTGPPRGQSHRGSGGTACPQPRSAPRARAGRPGVSGGSRPFIPAPSGGLLIGPAGSEILPATQRVRGETSQSRANARHPPTLFPCWPDTCRMPARHFLHKKCLLKRFFGATLAAYFLL
jgi:hypothetical protein